MIEEVSQVKHRNLRSDLHGLRFLLTLHNNLSLVFIISNVKTLVMKTGSVGRSRSIIVSIVIVTLVNHLYHLLITLDNEK